MIQIDINDEEEEKFIKSVLENLPEASFGMVLKCTSYNYKDCKFEFIDEEENVKHLLTMKNAKVGLRKLINAEVMGKCFVLHSPRLFDAGEWDSLSTDALVQFSLLGDLVYG